MVLEEFYDEHVEKVYKFFYFKSLNKQVAEDLTQETWMRFIEKQGSTVEDSKKYLYGVMRNCWLEFLREKYSTITSEIEQVDDFEDYVNSENVASTSDDLPRRVQQFVDLLPDKQRQVFELRFVQGLNIKEASIELGKDKNYIKTTYKRALSTLRAIIKEPYLYTEIPGERTNE